jgi:hypothetical protein
MEYPPMLYVPSKIDFSYEDLPTSLNRAVVAVFLISDPPNETVAV